MSQLGDDPKQDKLKADEKARSVIMQISRSALYPCVLLGLVIVVSLFAGGWVVSVIRYGISLFK
jgi:hypothetical protein